VEIDRRRLTAHLVDDEERLLAGRLLDVVEKALAKSEPQATDFYDPKSLQIATGLLGAIPQVSYKAYGGYAQAERQRLLIYPHYYMTEFLSPPLGAVEIAPVEPADNPKPAHHDYLGAVLGIGLKREKVGDLFLTSAGCQVILAQEVLPAVLSHLNKVNRYPVIVQEIDLEQLAVQPARVKEMQTTVASLRLDAVAAYGFGTSRTKMAREIKAGQVKLNWRQTFDPAAPVKAGDVISMRGRGRVNIDEVRGETRKGRTVLLLTRMY